MTIDDALAKEELALQQAQTMLAQIEQARMQQTQEVLRCQGAVQALHRLRQAQRAVEGGAPVAEETAA